MKDKYASLRLKNQLCFPLYAVSNMITRKYKPLLDKLDLTYTQYIVMMVLWEEKQVNEKFLCEALCLKSNTVTPLLKKLQAKGYIDKAKDSSDERNLVITLTKAGEMLQDKALCVPEAISKEFSLTPEEAMGLYKTLYKMLDQERTNTDTTE
ncbi:MAG: MarR family transcriptional regulator [Oscillospiraceae bacterium]|nr:MarR family transcriptional regulator [Oscillospiraceae bacterium]